MKKWFVEDAMRTVLFSYSCVLTTVAFLLLMVPELIYAQTEIDYDPYTLTITAAVLYVCTLIGRVMKQDPDTMRVRGVAFFVLLLLVALSVVKAYGLGPFDPAVPDSKTVTATPPEKPATVQTATSQPAPVGVWASVSKLARPMVVKWEGSHKCKDDKSMHCTYLDRIAEPDLPTACYGETHGVKMGERYTEQFCQGRLDVSLRKHWSGWLRAVTVPRADVPAPVHAAAASLTYNIGIGAARKASMTKAINRRNWADACKRMTRYNRAGGRVIRGLVNRRADEYGVCMTFKTGA